MALGDERFVSLLRGAVVRSEAGDLARQVREDPCLTTTIMWVNDWSAHAFIPGFQEDANRTVARIGDERPIRGSPCSET